MNHTHATADAQAPVTGQGAAPAAAPSAPFPVPTMRVGHAEDHLEGDADRRADRALARLATMQGDGGAPPSPPVVRRTSTSPGCSGGPVAGLPVVGYEGGVLDPRVSSAIGSRVGRGRSLDGGLRRQMETAFGADLSSVRVHDDPGSATLNRLVGARAFTTGKDVFFGAGEFAPETAEGQRVLAHELAHTLQPTGGGGLHRLVDPDPHFGRRQVLSHPDWHTEAQKFEKRLGVFAYRHPDATTAATAAVARLGQVLVAKFGDEERTFRSFVKDAPDSAGQIGDTGTSEQAIRDLVTLGQGTVRELMTAFYNAAYYKGANAPSDRTLKKIVNDIAQNPSRPDRTTESNGLGLNTVDLNAQADFLNSSYRSFTEWLIGRVKPDKAYLFSRDLFALGNIASQSAAWTGDLMEIGTSQYARSDRSQQEKDGGKHKNTPREYEQLGIPLSARELAFMTANQAPLAVSGFDIEEVDLGSVTMDPVTGEPDLVPLRSAPNVLSVEVRYEMDGGAKRIVDDKVTVTKIMKIVSAPKQWTDLRAGDVGPGEQGPMAPLSWVEGSAWFQIDPTSGWYKQVHDTLGMPVVAGVSGTTSRMLKAFSWLNVPGVTPQQFRTALLGWMLPSWDHSLYEILRGSHLYGLGSPDERASVEVDAVEMYKNVAPFTVAELRQHVCENRMFPDEVIYSRMARKDRAEGGFGEPGPDGVTRADAIDAKLTTAKNDELAGRGVDANIQNWLTTNATTAKSVWESLSPAHLLALISYTGSGHSMINLVAGSASLSGELLDRGPHKYLFTRKLKALLADSLAKKGEKLPSSLAEDVELKPLIAAYGQLPASPANQLALVGLMNARIDVISGQLFGEMEAHIDMLLAALRLLPPATGVVHRGDWKVGGVSKSGILGSVLNGASTLFGTYGSKSIELNEFASASRVPRIALGFLKNYESTASSHPVLLDLTLTGGGGRDISIFSKYPSEKEVLFMPGTRFAVKTVVEEEIALNNGKKVWGERITATEA